MWTSTYTLFYLFFSTTRKGSMGNMAKIKTFLEQNTHYSHKIADYYYFMVFFLLFLMNWFNKLHVLI